MNYILYKKMEENRGGTKFKISILKEKSYQFLKNSDYY